MFPRFMRNQPGSITDASIQGWLNDASGTVHAAFYNRGLNTDNLSHPKVSDPTQATPVTNQADILREFVRNYGIWRLASAIWATLSVTEQSMARGAYQRWETNLKGISAGLYDSLFWLYSRTTDIEPAFSGIAGGETDSTPTVDEPNSDNKPFWLTQVF